MFAAIGRRLSSSGRHRRPPPVAAVVPLSSLILASTSSPLSSPVVVLSHPAAGIADLGLGCYTSVRRRVAVVVVGSWLCSPPPVGSVSMLARAGGQNTTKHEGHTGTSDSAPRFCSVHQNTAAAPPEPTPPANRTVPAPSAAAKAKRAH